MERYEINRYFTLFETKLKDLYIALKIEKNIPVIKELEEKISAVDFWNDQKTAQATINQANDLKQASSMYNDALSQFNSLKELDEMATDDPDAQNLLEEEIYAFDKKLESLEECALLSGEYDSLDAIIELHPGAGGTESMDWALMLYRMYQRYAARKGYKFITLDYQAGDEAGIKSVTFMMKGKYAYGMMKSERGVHRLVRISPFDANSRRHTSFASVDVAPNVEQTTDIEIKDDDIKIDVYHSSGAGGQSVNTTDSAVRITHKPTGIVVTCQNERSQIKNREVAMKILKSKLLELKIKEDEEKIRNIKGNQMGINFGSQIRSYVFTPYTLVKDHRTECEMGNVQAVMDGDIDQFINAYLKQEAGK